LRRTEFAGTLMNDHQRETAFLRRCILYDDTDERHRLEERITKLQGDERSVRRAVWLMTVLAALAMAALGYVAVFLADYPLNVSQLTARFFIKSICALGAGSVLCLFVFFYLGAALRKELDQRREDCRRLALKVLESHLGRPVDLRLPELGKERKPVVNGGESALSDRS